ncbi:MAG: ABC transporter permease subunit [Ignavibacteriaceae bacterium]
MITIINIELYKIFKKWRTYIGFIAIALIVALVQIAMYIQGERSIDFMTRDIQQSFVFVGNLLNGYLISYLILNTLHIQIPFLIALVAGDLLAGEATAGTYRLLITRPVSRFSLITSKFLAGMIYTTLLVCWLAFVSLVLGFVLFGSGELIVLKPGGLVIFARDDVFWRFLLSYGFAALSMLVVASLAFLLSSLVENAIGPIVTTMAIIIIFLVISQIPVDIFQDIEPYLFTTYSSSWRLFFDDPINFGEVTKSVLILAAHVAVFYFVTIFIFKRKDILS